jgi:arginyl-tRNA synthetase
MYDPNTHMDFDLDLAKERSEKNPVYYVQYAHARISSILKKADSRQLTASGNLTGYNRLTISYELDLIKQLTRLPELIEEIARDFQVQRIAFYATSLADSFHRFYENCKVLTDDKELSRARLQLVLATGIVLKSTLGILGVSAPEKM